MTATNSAQGMTAFISARNRSRRVTFVFAVQASPANVRCSLMLRCSRVKRTHRSDGQYRTFPPTRQEAILQSFPSGAAHACGELAVPAYAAGLDGCAVRVGLSARHAVQALRTPPWSAGHRGNPIRRRCAAGLARRDQSPLRRWLQISQMNGARVVGGGGISTRIASDHLGVVHTVRRDGCCGASKYADCRSSVRSW